MATQAHAPSPAPSIDREKLTTQYIMIPSLGKIIHIFRTSGSDGSDSEKFLKNKKIPQFDGERDLIHLQETPGLRDQTMGQWWYCAGKISGETREALIDKEGKYPRITGQEAVTPSADERVLILPGKNKLTLGVQENGENLRNRYLLDSQNDSTIQAPIIVGISESLLRMH